MNVVAQFPRHLHTGYVPRPLNEFECRIVAEWDDVAAVYSALTDWADEKHVGDAKRVEINIAMMNARKSRYSPIAACERIREILAS